MDAPTLRSRSLRIVSDLLLAGAGIPRVAFVRAGVFALAAILGFFVGILDMVVSCSGGHCGLPPPQARSRRARQVPRQAGVRRAPSNASFAFEVE
jgi:hypothetical protein